MIVLFIVLVLSITSFAEANKLYKEEESEKYPFSCAAVKKKIRALQKQSLATMIIALVPLGLLSFVSIRKSLQNSLTETIISWINIVLLLVLFGLSISLASLWSAIKTEIDKKGSTCINTSVKAGQFKSITITTTVFTFLLFVILLLRKMNINIIQLIVNKIHKERKWQEYKKCRTKESEETCENVFLDPDYDNVELTPLR